MFRCLDIKRAGLQDALHCAELVFNLCQSMVLINDFPGIHGQFRCDDLVVSEAFSVFRYLVKINECLDLCGIQDLAGLFIDAFLFEKFTQAFRLGCCDAEIFRVFLQHFQKIKELFVFPLCTQLKLFAPINNHLFFDGPLVSVFIFHRFLHDSGFIFEIIAYRNVTVIAVCPFLFFFRAFQQAF